MSKSVRIAAAAACAATLALAATAFGAGTVTITAGPAEGSYVAGPTASFEFTSSGVSSVVYRCTLDGAEAGCSSPFVTSALANGPHTFSVIAMDSGGLNQTPPATRHFNVGPQLPVQILSTSERISRSGRFGIDLGCPAASSSACTGTVRVRIDCCQAGAGRTDRLRQSGGISDCCQAGAAKKHVANIKWVDAPITIAAGKAITVTYKATQGKTGRARALIASARTGKSGAVKNVKRVEVAVLQPGVETLPGSSYSANTTVQIRYTAKKGKTGSAK